MAFVIPRKHPQLKGWRRALNELAGRSAWKPDDLSWHSRQITNHGANLERLRRRVSEGRIAHARRLQDHVLNSFAGGLCAVLEQLRVEFGTQLPSISPAELEKRIRAMNPMRRRQGAARVILKPKADGTRRVIIAPKADLRDAQRLVDHVLQCWSLPNSSDYNRSGRGRDAALLEIVRLFEQGEASSFVIFDLKNYFPSLKPTHLEGWLPLPNQAIKHSLFFNREVPLFHPTWNGDEARVARHSLPAGARLSGSLAAALLGRELRQLDGVTGSVTFVDDGVLGCCDPAGAKDLAETLQCRLSNHPGGPLSCNFVNIVTPEEGFAFLGYWVSLEHSEGGEKIRLRPSHQARKRFEKGVSTRLKALKEASYDTALKCGDVYLAKWRRSFGLWKPDEAEVQFYRALVSCFVDDFLCLKAPTSATKM